MRDARTEPKPGDIYAGPIVKLRVDRVTYVAGMKLETVEFTICHRNREAYKGHRKLTAAEFINFVSGEKTEVLHVAE